MNLTENLSGRRWKLYRKNPLKFLWQRYSLICWKMFSAPHSAKPP